jgi:hypothetical protein
LVSRAVERFRNGAQNTIRGSSGARHGS